MKKFVALFISFILIFNFIAPSYANLIDNLQNVSINTNVAYGGDLTKDNDSNSAKETPDSSKPNAILQMILDAIESALNIITSPIKAIIMIFPTVEDSIWAESRTVQLSFFNESSTPLASSGDGIRGIVGSIYNGLRYLVAAIYIIILVYLGIRMILSSMGRQKAHYKMMLQHWLMGLLLLFAFHWVMAFIIWISYKLTFAFQTLGVSAFTAASFTDKSLVTHFIINRITADALEINAFIPTIGTVIAPFWLVIGYIILIVFGFVIFFTYLKRLFTVALLIVLFPLVVLSYVFDKMGDRRAQTFSTWFREFTVNVFLQPIHAFLLSMIAFLFNAIEILMLPIVGSICSLLLLALIPIGEKQLKTLFQINSSMGPGNGGIAGTVAHAGMALDTLKRGANSLVEMKKNFTNLKNAGEYQDKMIQKAQKAAGKQAVADAKRRGITDPDQLAKIRKDARKNAKKDLLKDADYKAEMKRRTGYSSLDEAKSAMKKRVVAKTLGTSAGVGTALATGTSVGDLAGKLIGNGIAGAALASTLQGTAEAWKNVDKPIESPELEKAKASAKKGDLDKISDAEKENMAKVLGIDRSLLTEKTPGIHDLINKRLKGRREALKYGITFDNPLVDSFDPDYYKSQNIKNGMEPDGSGIIDWNNYDRAVTKNGTYVRNKITKEIIKIGNGHSNASDDVIWEDGDDKDHSRFASKLDERAIEYADKMAARFGFDQNDDRYKNILKDERKKNNTILAAHSSCCDHLMSLNHNMLSKPAFQAYDDCTYRFLDFNEARQGLSTEQIKQVNSSFATYVDDMVFNPNDANSKTQIINKAAALEVGGLSSIKSICGSDYTAFMNGTLNDNSRFQDIAQQIQASYANVGEDYQKAVVANIVDMEARANSTMSGLFGDTTKTISQEAIATAVTATTGVNASQFTSTQLKDYISGLNIAQKQELSNNLTVIGQAEHRAMPDTGKIINASNQGLMTTSVDISSAPNNLAQAFNVTPGEKVLVSTTVGPINPTTGLATVTLASLGNPNQTVTFESDIDTGGELTNIYGGELSLDNNGNIQLLRTEKTADYTFTPPSTSNAQPFYEFDLSELQQICGNSDTDFSIIKYDNICAIMDSNGQFRAVKRGSEQAKESKLIQYTITRNNNGELEYTTSTPTNDIWKLHIAARNKNANPDDVALIKQLLDIK